MSVAALGLAVRRRRPGREWPRRHPGVFDDQPVDDADRSVRIRGHRGVVGDQEHGDARCVELLEHLQNFDARVRIQIARRLVGQEQRRLVHQRPCDRYALLLPAGHLRRHVLDPIAESHAVQELACALLRFGRSAVHGRVIQRHEHVVDRGGPRQQVEALKDEPELGRAHQRPLVRRQAAHVLAVEPILARGGPIEAAQDVHERAFAGPRSAHQGDHLAALDRYRHALQHGDVDLAHVVGLGNVLDAKQFHDDTWSVERRKLSARGAGPGR